MSTALSIGEHALIGDGRALALVGSDGTIDWLTLPHDERLAVFDALLDADDGGRFTLRPVEDAEISRRYLSDSMVLETTFTTPHGRISVTDCFTLHNGALLPWVELVRRIHCHAGRVPIAWSVQPSLVLGGRRRAFVCHRGYLQVAEQDVAMGLLHWDAGAVSLTDRGVAGDATLVAGDDATIAAVVVSGGEPLPRPDRAEVEARVDRTVGTWQSWSQGIRYGGRWRDQVQHSARVLKTLLHSPTGAILAAPTTSLPERIGGDRNYDYRYCWTRDASFTIDALLRVNLVEEAHAAIRALVQMAGSTAPRLAPFYRVDGSVPTETATPDLPGYRDSRPVRCGNGASSQLQLGGWGDLFEALWIYVRQGNELDRETGELLTVLTDELCDRWGDADSGIWELPDQCHYTISKMGSWVAFDRALRMVDVGQLDGHPERWRREREAVRGFVLGECWSRDRRSFTFHAGSEELDAACLLASRFGFVDGTSAEMIGTIRAVQEELAEGPFVWRYSGQQDREGAFLACSFWLGEALTRAGLDEEAALQIDGTLAAMNDVGLLAEEYDPRCGELLGNFPQGLSHLALVTVASMYDQAVSTGRRHGA